MSNARAGDFQPEETIGEGNCALNAFALGLISPDLLQHLDLFLQHEHLNPDQTFADFIRVISGVLEIEPTWRDVSQALLRIRQHDKRRLQYTLAPLLRIFVVNEMSKDPNCLEKTIKPMVSAFRDALSRAVGISFKGLQDDVYTKHAIFQQQVLRYRADMIESLDSLDFSIARYNALRAQAKLSPSDALELKRLEKTLDYVFAPLERRIEQWWRFGDVGSPGYEQFLSALKQNGEWLGDLELSYLAAYFHLDLDVYRAPFFYSIHLNQLLMPRHLLSDTAIKQLQARGVIEPCAADTANLVFLPFATMADLKNRMCVLPMIESAMACYFLQPELKQQLVPDFLMPVKTQLAERNIIARDGDKDVFIVNAADAIDRSIEAEGYDVVVKWWRDHHYPAPKMTLSNANVHWENMILTRSHSLAAESPLRQSVMRAPSSLFIKKWAIANHQVLNASETQVVAKLPAPVLIGIFLACYVALIALLRRGGAVEIAAAADPGDGLLDARGSRDRRGEAALAGVYGSQNGGVMAPFAVSPWGLFNRNQYVNLSAGQDSRHVLALPPSRTEAASFNEALKRLPCTIL